MRIFSIIGAIGVALCFFLFSLAVDVWAAEAAEPSLQELIQDRQAANGELEALKKENDVNVAAFNKVPAVVEFNVKQKILSDKFTKAQGKVIELNGKIADKVAKDGGKK